jgi:hypothetical protein
MGRREPAIGRPFPSRNISAGTTIEPVMARRDHNAPAIDGSAGVVVRTAFGGMLGTGVHAARISGPDRSAGAFSAAPWLVERPSDAVRL